MASKFMLKGLLTTLLFIFLAPGLHWPEANAGWGRSPGPSRIFMPTNPNPGVRPNYSNYTPPHLKSFEPAADATSVPSSANIVIEFDHPMIVSYINTNTIKLLGPYLVEVSGQWVPVSRADNPNLPHTKFKFTPTNPLPVGSHYVVIVTKGVTDIYGNNLEEDKSWTFSTTAMTNVVWRQSYNSHSAGWSTCSKRNPNICFGGEQAGGTEGTYMCPQNYNGKSYVITKINTWFDNEGGMPRVVALQMQCTALGPDGLINNDHFDLPVAGHTDGLLYSKQCKKDDVAIGVWGCFHQSRLVQVGPICSPLDVRQDPMIQRSKAGFCCGQKMVNADNSDFPDLVPSGDPFYFENPDDDTRRECAVEGNSWHVDMFSITTPDANKAMVGADFNRGSEIDGWQTNWVADLVKVFQ